jgi:hypothetical protein
MNLRANMLKSGLALGSDLTHNLHSYPI